MRYILLVFSFLFTLNLFAQDTVKVNTFNWSSTNRADTFSFPDNPNETYRKILMIYNMRCHDAIVGNGSTGCLEWDYSCNTFITDPSRIDSVRQSHANYIVSNFSGTDFNYTTKPTYTYYQYDQHNTTLTGNITQSAAVGSFGSTVELNPGQHTSRLQFLYLKSELSSKGLTAGDIQRIKMDIETLDAVTLGFFRIKIKQTSANSLNPDQPELDGFTEVYFKNTLFYDTGLIDYNFYTPFNWDGNSNLIIEFSYTSEPGAYSVTAHGNDAGFNCALASTDDDYALYFEGSGSANVNPTPLSDISNEISVSVWTYGSPKFLPTNSTLFEGGDANNQRAINVHLPWSDSRVYWDCGRDAGGGVDRIDKLAVDQNFKGSWNNWVFTKNVTSGEMKIYLNGNLWHSGTGLKRPIDINALNFGSAISWVNNYFGSIDEFQLWNKALDENTIKTWMRKSIDNTHPYYNNLVAYYKLNEGSGNIMHSSSATDYPGNLQIPNWQRIKGAELYRNFKVGTKRPLMLFDKGNFTISDEIIKVLDSTQNNQNQVVHFGLNGSQLTTLDTQYVYAAGYMPVYNEAGVLVDSVLANKEGTINISNFYHYLRSKSRFELLSLVTPYGINLDLGKKGKSFTFDVTDYAPILKGDKYMSIEFGGQWQEELDIQFLFIKGTPPREVRNIQNIWPQGNGGHGDILNDNVFEPRSILLDPNASYYKIRSAITGHGQNGEFVPQEHFININGGPQEFTYQVWKACGKNPIYPQGGTWVFDRAGWCPGMATDVHEFDISLFKSPGIPVTIDYGINAAPMGAANYLVSNQLVSYGAYNFTTDASVETIMKPNNKSVEYERINPSCNMPTILVKNTGSSVIQSLEIQYLVLGGNALTYEWTGQLDPGLSVEIELPVKSSTFWYTPNVEKIFEANIIKVNGITDEYTDNNTAISSFTLAKEFSFSDPLQVRIQTNLVASDNSYTIVDSDGKVIFSRDNMANNTTYVDEIDVEPGCYTFKFEDSSGDGLSFWFFPDNGNGTLKLERLLNGTVPIVQKTFNPDMGGGVQYDFIRGSVVSKNDEIEGYTLLSLYPNPTSDILNVELHGYQNQKIQLSIVDLTGKKLISKSVKVSSDKYIEQISVADLNPGMYFLKMNNGKKEWVKQIIRE